MKKILAWVLIICLAVIILPKLQPATAGAINPPITLIAPNSLANGCQNWVVKSCVSTTPAKIEAEFTGSPLKGYGQRIYDLGIQYGVDPNFFMAIAKAESLYATVPSIALSNHNPGSLRPGRGGATKASRNFAYFDTWEQGIEAFYKHISGFYFSQNLTTVDGILWKYAPPQQNDTPGYIVKIKARLNALQVK